MKTITTTGSAAERLLAIKNPMDAFWIGARFDMYDGSGCILRHPNGSILLYWSGGDVSENIYLPPIVVDAIRHIST